MSKVFSIVGARPQFIKAAPVLAALRQMGHESLLLHTGQHYDSAMSDSFFEELQIQSPDFNLHVGSGVSATQIAKMLLGITDAIGEVRPDWVLVFGDTNSTLAGALSALKTGVRLAHVEAGLRSFNWDMPEEQNRILTDRCSNLHFCPTVGAIQQLEKEGLAAGAHLTGDPMVDALRLFAGKARQKSEVFDRLKLKDGQYLLATIHRAYNTDSLENLETIIRAFSKLDEKIIFPVHPRTREKMKGIAIEGSNVTLIEPVGFLDMLRLQQGARLVLTDSGGVQKEAFLLGIPCVTLRPETEWIDTVALGRNIVTGIEFEKISRAVKKTDWPTGTPPPVFGDGRASEKIAAHLA